MVREEAGPDGWTAPPDRGGKNEKTGVIRKINALMLLVIQNRRIALLTPSRSGIVSE